MTVSAVCLCHIFFFKLVDVFFNLLVFYLFAVFLGLIFVAKGVKMFCFGMNFKSSVRLFFVSRFLLDNISCLCICFCWDQFGLVLCVITKQCGELPLLQDPDRKLHLTKATIEHRDTIRNQFNLLLSVIINIRFLFALGF